VSPRVIASCVFAAIAFVSCARGQASSLREPPPEPPGRVLHLADNPDVKLVSARLTHAEGQQVAFVEEVRVRSSATFEGQIVNLPLGASVWIAVRCPAPGAESWRVLFPAASVEPTGHWRVRVQMPRPQGNRRLVCEVKALVSSDIANAATSGYDENWMREHVVHSTTAIEVHVLPDATPASTASLDVTSIAETAVETTQPIVVPAVFGVGGASANLAPRSRIVVGASCTPGQWAVIAHAAAGADGAWHVDALTLPPLATGAQRGCVLQAFSGLDVPPAAPADERTLMEWATTRSPAVAIVRNPYYLAIAALTDFQGTPLLGVAAKDRTRPIALKSPPASMEIEADALPDGMRVYQLLRCEGCPSWHVASPAQLVESGRYAVISPVLRFPGRPTITRFATMAIASREDLEGRVLSATELAYLTQGASRLLNVEHVSAARRTPARARIAVGRLRAAGYGPKADGYVDLRRGTLDVTADAELPSPRHALFVGYRAPDSPGLWYFHRAMWTGHQHRVAVPIPVIAERPAGGGPNSLLVPVIAEALPVDRGIQHDFWIDMVDAIGDPVPALLPTRPWYSRASRRIAAVFRKTPVAASPSLVPSPSQEQEPDMISPTLVLLALAVLVLLWLAGPKIGSFLRRVQVIWNARLDARAARAHPEMRAGPFLDVIEGWTADEVARAERKFAPRIARARAKREVAERKLETVYEPEYQRLVGKTGRYEPIVLVSSRWHRVAQIVLNVGEGAFNLTAFYVFMQPQVETLVMALAVAVAIPICATALGAWVRQWPSPWYLTAFLIATVTSVVVWGLNGLNQVRMAFLASVAPEFLKQAPGVEQAFLSVNLLVLLAGSVISYCAHDPEQNFAEVAATRKSLTGIAGARASRMQGLDQQRRAAIDKIRARGQYYAALYRTVFERRRHPKTSRGGDVLPAVQSTPVQ
jgi:hypothetical protein